MNRIYHHWEEWECYRAGFYATAPPVGMDTDQARSAYATFLRDSARFAAALARVLAEWPNSCEQFLSNENINRIAWLGQASMCIATGVPARFRGGFRLLSIAEQAAANTQVGDALHKWLASRERAAIDMSPLFAGVAI